MIQNNKVFGVPIGNAKMVKKVQFHPEAPLIQYHKKSYNSCCLSSLASALHCIDDNRSVYDLINFI